MKKIKNNIEFLNIGSKYLYGNRIYCRYKIIKKLILFQSIKIMSVLVIDIK